MAEPPNATRGLLAGLMRVLHLHQLPQSSVPVKNTPTPTPIRTASPGEIQPISIPINSSPRNTISSSNPFSAPNKTPASMLARSSAPIVAVTPTRPAARTIPLTPTSTAPSPKAWPASSIVAQHHSVHVSKGFITTDYDRILDLVREHTTIKLDEIARLLSLKEELVAQELQTLEDNGLVDVKYPAFGEPLIYYKTPEV